MAGAVAGKEWNDATRLSWEMSVSMLAQKPVSFEEKKQRVQYGG